MRRAFFVLVLLAAVPAFAKPPVWDQRIDAPKRFKVLKPFASSAVLDVETGLVWMRAANGNDFAYAEAVAACTNAEVGGRGGWRLPTAAEIRSLVPPLSQALPAGHPFTAADGLYWSSTLVTDSLFAFVGDLGDAASQTLTQDTTSDY